ncbi:MAG TPA: MnhB domain-containing protein [Vulgatibacter sp.]|nr:MnhB domain-containing protein [Vulgatibacter sp.]
MSLLAQSVVRLLFLPSLVVATAFCVRGSTGMGDGFSAGLVAAIATSLVLLAFGPRQARRILPLRHAPATAGIGLLLVVGSAVVPALVHGIPLEHFPRVEFQVVRLGALAVNSSLLFDAGIAAVVAGGVVHVLDRAASTDGQDA